MILFRTTSGFPAIASYLFRFRRLNHVVARQTSAFGTTFICSFCPRRVYFIVLTLALQQQDEMRRPPTDEVVSNRRRSLKLLLQIPLLTRSPGYRPISAHKAVGSIPEDIILEIADLLTPADVLSLSLTVSLCAYGALRSLFLSVLAVVTFARFAIASAVQHDVS